LQGIQWQAVNYWQRKGAMPNALADLNDSISGYVAPVDPETGVPYEYTLQNAAALKFQICATFSLENQEDRSAAKPLYPYDMGSQSWNHPAGRHCFDRQIDQQLYPPLNNGK
jgi:hypothetical protein